MPANVTSIYGNPLGYHAVSYSGKWAIYRNDLSGHNVPLDTFEITSEDRMRRIVDALNEELACGPA